MKRNLICAFSALTLATSFSHATLTGLDDDPLGSHSSPYVKYAVWDSFSSASAGTLDGGSTLSGATLSQGTAIGAPGGVLPGDGGSNDLLYTFRSATSWTISGSSSLEISKLVLQVKLSSPAQTSLLSYLTPTLNGVGTTGVVTETGITNGGFTFNVVQFTWDNLLFEGNDPWTILINTPAGNPAIPPNGNHVAFDAFQVDTVPEPTTAVLAGLGLGALLLKNRRRVVRE